MPRLLAPLSEALQRLRSVVVHRFSDAFLTAYQDLRGWAFTAEEREVAWAQEVLEAFDAAGGAALRLPDGEFVDLPVAQRARRVLQLAEAVPRVPAGV